MNGYTRVFCGTITTGDLLVCVAGESVTLTDADPFHIGADVKEGKIVYNGFPAMNVHAQVWRKVINPFGSECRIKFSEDGFTGAGPKVQPIIRNDSEFPKSVVDKYAANPLKSESEIEEARRLVCGDRNEAYGTPADDYGRTAKMVSGLLKDILKRDITPKEMIMVMICVKLSREMHKPKRDNRVDAHGYLLCAEWVETGIKPQ